MTISVKSRETLLAPRGASSAAQERLRTAAGPSAWGKETASLHTPETTERPGPFQSKGEPLLRASAHRFCSSDVAPRPANSRASFSPENFFSRGVRLGGPEGRTKSCSRNALRGLQARYWGTRRIRARGVGGVA